MIEIGRTYNFRKELCEELQITSTNCDGKLERQLEQLKYYFDCDIIRESSHPIKVKINKILHDWEKIDIIEQRLKDGNILYQEFLDKEIEKNGGLLDIWLASEKASNEFGRRLYGHTQRAAYGVIKDIIEKEYAKKYTWRWEKTNKLITEEELTDWDKIKNKCGFDKKAQINYAKCIRLGLTQNKYSFVKSLADKACEEIYGDKLIYTVIYTKMV